VWPDRGPGGDPPTRGADQNAIGAETEPRLDDADAAVVKVVGIVGAANATVACATDGDVGPGGITARTCTLFRS
jgi:hypothetical protein